MPGRLPPVRKPPSHKQKEKTITKAELDALNERIYSNTMARKKENSSKLEKKFYGEAPKKIITQEALSVSLQRQVDEELKRRKKKAEDLDHKYYKPETFKKLSTAEVDDSIRRIYADAMRQKEDSLKKHERKADELFYATHPSKKLTLPEIEACGSRLCKPAKREYTDEEMNKVLFGK